MAAPRRSPNKNPTANRTHLLLVALATFPDALVAALAAAGRMIWYPVVGGLVASCCSCAWAVVSWLVRLAGALPPAAKTLRASSLTVCFACCSWACCFPEIRPSM